MSEGDKPTTLLPALASAAPSGSSRRTGSAAGSGLRAAQRVDYFKLAHRYLRGRYPMVLTLGLLCAIVGAAVGWRSGKRLYRSEGMIQIAYAAPTVLPSNPEEREPVEVFQGFLQAQEMVLGGRTLAEEAVRRPEWAGTGRGMSPKAIEGFVNSVKVETRSGTDFIWVSFADRQPDVAAAGLRSLIGAYRDAFDRQDGPFQHRRLEVLHDRQANLRTQLAELQEKVRQAAQAGPAAAPRLTQQQIAVTDPNMRAYLAEVEQLQDQATALRLRGYGDHHPEVQRVQAAIDAAERRAGMYADTYRAFRAADAATALSGGTTVGHPVLDPLRTEIERVSNELAQVSTRYEAIQDQVRLGNQLRVISAGDVPLVPFQDKRPQAALMGAAAGCVLPAAAFVLLGLLGNRYRCSDEPAEDLSARARLLGILPVLSGSPLKDRERAIGAAQCVHQIRVMLELGQAKGRVPAYLISSASPGEGKTSLTAALGLSFAASGSRTLLIDIDLMGHRLTRGFTQDRLSGLCDVLATGKIEGHPRKTSRERLDLLPVGRLDALHAGTLSSSAVHTLVAEARKHYDVVLVDSGPVLGSVEAALVAPEVDGVVMVVARHQQRTMVDKAIQTVDQVGGRLVGLVFNRAETWDFQRSMSASNRSLGADGRPARLAPVRVTESWRLGPLVRSVASFLPAQDGLDASRATNGAEDDAAAVDEPTLQPE